MDNSNQYKSSQKVSRNPSNDNEQSHENEKIVRGKIFCHRESVLTDLMKTSHFKSIYNFFVAVLIILFINKALRDIFNNGRTSLGFDFIIAAFGKFHYVIFIWILMQFFALFPYMLLKIWFKGHNILNSKSTTWNALMISIFGIFQLGFLVYSIKLVCKYDLPIVSSFVVLLEMVRFLMKNYAFIRSTAPSLFHDKKPRIPEFSSHLYFLFAPTLIYRDFYPRTNKINWNAAMKGIIEIMACTFCVNHLCTHFIIYPWKDFGLKELEFTVFLKLVFESMIPSFVSNLCGFYLLLHSWHNTTAELLKFADRQFYTDWWNQPNFSGYYRTWNIIVHDWLYTYVYKDVIFLTRNKLAGQLLVFLISAIFHEIVITFAFKFFYPVMLVIFGGIGVGVIFITKYLNSTLGNVFIWFALIFGDGMLWSFYAIEYFSRLNCPFEYQNTFLNYSIPRTIYCHKLIFSEEFQ